MYSMKPSTNTQSEISVLLLHFVKRKIEVKEILMVMPRVWLETHRHQTKPNKQQLVMWKV